MSMAWWWGAFYPQDEESFKETHEHLGNVKSILGPSSSWEHCAIRDVRKKRHVFSLVRPP